MIWQNVRLALKTILGNKLRSVLTMLGIIIGVSSVTIVISLGNGFKQQIQGEITNLGANLVSVVPGDLFSRDEGGQIALNQDGLTSAFGVSTLTTTDLQSIKDDPDVEAATPIMVISGVVTHQDEQVAGASLIATDSDLPLVLNQELIRGAMFDGDENENLAVIGSGIAQDLFGSTDATTGIIYVRGDKFVVTGVLEPRDEAALSELSGFSLDRAVYIPLARGAEYNQGATALQEIDLIVKEDADVEEVVARLEETLLDNHGGQKDFSVLKQEDFLSLTDTFTTIATQFVAAIAGISLFVGGIGIMNIMLVSVTERTREIGLRKAIGASKAHILMQFLIESAILSAIGGLLGVGLAYFGVAMITLFTDFTGAFDLATIALATGVSALVGIVAGLWPAWQAARKDPIRSLRFE